MNDRRATGHSLGDALSVHKKSYSNDIEKERDTLVSIVEQWHCALCPMDENCRVAKCRAFSSYQAKKKNAENKDHQVILMANPIVLQKL